MKKISLRAKLSVFSSLLVLGVASSVGVSLYLAERHYLIQRVQQSQLEIVQFLAQVAGEAEATRNHMLLSSYLGLIRRSRALSYALVTDQEGTVIAHSNPGMAGQRTTDAAALRALASPGLLRQTVEVVDDELVDLALPVILEGRRAGTARVGYSQSATRQLVDQTLLAARRRIALATAVSFAAGLLVTVVLAYFLTRPIQHLMDGAREIGGGALDHRIRVTSRDELGELAEEFNVMAARLQELDRLKQDFVSNVTHELRSPLTSLRGYVEFLLRESAGPLTDEQRDYLIVVKNNAIRLGRFIDNLLDVAKIEAGRVELHREAVALSGLGREMAVLFRPQAQEKNIDFREDVPADVPAVWADPDKLSEILINLLSNAFKFTPERGRVSLSARAEGDAVHVEVRDSGMGIPAAALESVFNKFEQVKPTQGLARRTKGTGLGLTIVKGFIEAHGGKVWIESPGEGAGATVHFTLPRAKKSPTVAYEEEGAGA